MDCFASASLALFIVYAHMMHVFGCLAYAIVSGHCDKTVINGFALGL